MSDAYEFENSGSEIAVIGMSCRFPQAANTEEFWVNLRDGVESISFFSEAELLAAGVEPSHFRKANYVGACAQIEGFDMFDASFFGFTPREAESTDPQHRLFLEHAWEALENAGYSSDVYQGRIGVYAGVGVNLYLLQNLLPNRPLMEALGSLQTVIQNDKDFLATRASYKLNLRGPSVVVQTACSTSLVAIHLACQSLLGGESDIMLAGGVSVRFLRKSGYFFQEGGIASPDGHCRAFDARAAGTVGGDGVGIVVLKRLTDALADKDTILAVIKGSAINNDGAAKIGYTAPGAEGQAQVIAEALAISGVDPETISYVEAHGTGTPLGDPIELAALNSAFGTGARAKKSCAIGSVKTNIGHLDAASGVAGLIKTVLALGHRQLPPSLNYQTPNPEIDFDGGPFYVNSQLAEWTTTTTPRRAGVSSFGIGGTNAHVVVEEAPPASVQVSVSTRSHQLLTLSAKTDSALSAMTQNLAEHLKLHPQARLVDVAYTLQVGRKALGFRRAFCCRDSASAISALEAKEGQRISAPAMNESPVAFMFSGQGAQHVGMARELYETEETFREQVNSCATQLEAHLGFDLREALYPEVAGAAEAAAQLRQTFVAQPALFVIEYALARLWMSWGVWPRAFIGHSIGEYVAACLAGVMTLEEALPLVAARGRLMQELPAGAMLAVPLTEAELMPLLNQALSLAAVNAPSRCVVAGPIKAVESLQSQLAERGVECRPLDTSHAFHSTMMEPIIERFIECLRKTNLRPPQIPYLSNVTGKWITAAEATNTLYWATHLRQTVRFADGISELLQTPDQILLEVGPGQTLSGLVRQQKDDVRDRLVLASFPARREVGSAVATTLSTLGRLWAAGVPIDWPAFQQGEQSSRIALPTYPFERKRYWVEAPAAQRLESVSPTLAERARHEKPEETKATTGFPLDGSVEHKSIARSVPSDGDGNGSQPPSARGLKRILASQLQLMAEQVALLHKLRHSESGRKMSAGVQPADSLPLTPIQHWFFAQKFLGPQHWNHSVLLEVSSRVAGSELKNIFQHLLARHDALRLRYVERVSGIHQFVAGVDEAVSFAQFDLSGLPDEKQAGAILETATQLQASLNLSTGPIMQVAYFDLGLRQPGRLLIIIHHLAVDISSWQILLNELNTAFMQLSREEAIALTPPTTSFAHWAEKLNEYAQTDAVRSNLPYWVSALSRKSLRLPVDYQNNANTEHSSRTISLELDVAETRTLLRAAPKFYSTPVSNILLATLVRTVALWAEGTSLLVDVEGHGRETICDGLNLSRTVGWFTSIFPVLIDYEKEWEPRAALESVKERMGRVPLGGISYGLLRYSNEDPKIVEAMRGLPHAEVCFNYWVASNGEPSETSPFVYAREPSGPDRSSQGTRQYLLEVDCVVRNAQLRIDWHYSQNIHLHSSISFIAQKFMNVLREFVAASLAVPDAVLLGSVRSLAPTPLR
jgi:non-ribosomal peptide synthase protein (TIGR01720 family)